jgi:uncharacterized protein (DUF58 family)
VTDASAGERPPAPALHATVRPTWQRTATIDAAMVVGLVIAAVGTLTSRVDVVLLALPLLASAAIGCDRRPTAGGRSTVRVDVVRGPCDKGSDEFGYRVAIDAPAGTDLVHLRLTPQGSRTRELVLAPRALGMVTGRIALLHSGRQRVVAITYQLVGVDGGWLSLPVPRQVAEKVVAPAITPIASIPLPHRLTGLTGTHGSARPGDGGEFRDVHPYACGDRLRRIDWKATARRSQGFGDLYVRRTDATSDATLILVIDSRDDVGERVEGWSGGPGEGGLTSMDFAREAAAALATAASGTGDRVGLHDLAAPGRVVAAGGGKRHLDRLLRRIEVSEPSGARLHRLRAPIVPAGAIVYLFSTFLDDEATSIAMLWRAVGHRVVAVDVLPVARLDGSDHGTRIAHRIVMAERRRRIADVRANGVEIFRWQEHAGQPSRAVALRTLARAGRRRRR